MENGEGYALKKPVKVSFTVIMAIIMMEGRMSMKFCSTCGNALIMKKHEHEGCIPYCTTCQKYIFPQFNTAVSLVALSPDEKQILLIQQ